MIGKDRSHKENIEIDPIDVDAQGFQSIEYSNDDVDTDRGVWRQRSFNILFKSHDILLSEEDFSLLVDAMKQYVHSAEAEEQLQKEMQEASE